MMTTRSPRTAQLPSTRTRSAAVVRSVARPFIGTSAASVPHISAVRRRVGSRGVRPSSGISGRYLLTSWIDEPEIE